MHPPIIGITLDAEESGGYSKLPWYALRQNYCTAVAAAGGVPLLLPHELAQVPAYLELIQGLVVTGGAFDVDPALFGAESRHPTVKLKGQRTAFELAITEGAIGRDMAVLGICGGAQLLNVVLGGSLIQHIPDEVPEALAHEQPNPRTEPGHTVKIASESRLFQIVRGAELAVNSAHHQAVKAPGRDVLIDARAPDGVVEGIEVAGRRFCLGVQWHPEYGISAGDHRLFEAFVAAAKERP